MKSFICCTSCFQNCHKEVMWKISHGVQHIIVQHHEKFQVCWLLQQCVIKVKVIASFNLHLGCVWYILKRTIIDFKISNDKSTFYQLYSAAYFCVEEVHQDKYMNRRSYLDLEMKILSRIVDDYYPQGKLYIVNVNQACTTCREGTWNNWSSSPSTKDLIVMKVNCQKLHTRRGSERRK